MPNAGYPVVVLNHGYIPPAQYSIMQSYKSFADYFPRQGFLLFKPDYRGHDDSEGYADGGHYSPSYTTDVLNLLSSVKKYPDADPERIGMWGHSMGGGVTLRALVAKPDAGVKSAVIMAGVVASADDLFYNWHHRKGPPPSPSERATYATSTRRELVAMYGEPKDNPEFWASVSPIQYVDVIDIPIQIHHGTNDASVPIAFSDALSNALKTTGKSVEYFIYEGGDHNIAGIHRATLLERTTSFFKKTL